MKIKLCGTGKLANDVARYFTVGKTYIINSTQKGQVFDVYGDDGEEHSPAIFKNGSKCAYLEDCQGSLWWELEE